MPSNRCFDLLSHTISNSSDYTIARKQKTIYAELAQNTSNAAIGPNPVKKNGSRYNMNYGLTSDTSNSCLKFAKSYELLLDVTKGKLFSNPVMNDSNSHEAEMWAGNTITVSYDNYPVVDISYNEYRPTRK